MNMNFMCHILQKVNGKEENNNYVIKDKGRQAESKATARDTLEHSSHHTEKVEDGMVQVELEDTGEIVTVEARFLEEVSLFYSIDGI